MYSLFEYTIAGIVAAVLHKSSYTVDAMGIASRDPTVSNRGTHKLHHCNDGGLSLPGPYFCAACAKKQGQVPVAFSHDVFGVYQYSSSLSYG